MVICGRKSGACDLIPWRKRTRRATLDGAVSSRKGPSYYIGVAVAVFVGGTAATLTVDYIEARIAIAQVEQFAEQATRSIRETQARTSHRLAEQRQARIEAVEERRRRSSIGRDLYRRCVEFTRFYKNNPGDYALEQREKACKAYRHYIETGQRAT